MPWIVLALLFLLLPLGTTPMEGATILVGLAALGSRRLHDQPLLGPALSIWAGLLLASHSLEPGTLWSTSLHAWAWGLLVVGPPVFGSLQTSERTRLEDVGLAAATVAGSWALVEVFIVGEPPWLQPVDGPFSHHLTLGYALLPALARALHRRRLLSAIAIGVGIACAGSSGPALSAAVVLLALLLPPGWALALGSAAAVVVIAALAGDASLLERSVLWTAGADVAIQHPGGAGTSGVRAATELAQARVMPGFHFPLHAHDSALQRAAVAGWGAWLAVTWALIGLWRRTDRAGRAAIAAIAVGGLTQDTLGDLEVVRAVCAWALLGCRDGDRLASSAAPTATSREPEAQNMVEALATQETP